MAELAASLVVGPLVSLLKDKVSSSLLDQYNVMEGREKRTSRRGAKNGLYHCIPSWDDRKYI